MTYEKGLCMNKKSFIPVDKDHLFPLANLPYGIFSSKKADEKKIVGVRIGDFAIDLSLLHKEGLLPIKKDVFSMSSLNALMTLSKKELLQLRLALTDLLSSNSSVLAENTKLRDSTFYHIEEINSHLPVQVGDYTDFYSSKEHASNLGAMFRDKNNPLLPNWSHIPIGYHGRSSSLIPSGTNIHRPMGQIMNNSENKPSFAACQRLDFELEMGFFVGKPSTLGYRIPIEEAKEHIFGMVIVNDWSARDIQKWEYVPLGPFTAKNFATSLSNWVVTMEALEPFKVLSVKQDPEPLAYLQHPKEDKWAYDIFLAVDLKPAGANSWHRISLSNTKYLYWSMIQQLTHHSVTGCNMQTGDLLASGTISGPSADSLGSLIEMTEGGTKPLILDGVQRRFLEDGDSVRMSAWCEKDDFKIGFGSVQTTILPCL